MKKIIALVVAILMIASMSVVAFAAGSVQGGQDNGNTTLLSYGVSEHYVVTIPAALDLSASETTVNVTLAEGYAIGYGKTLAVTVASTNGWKLEDAVNDGNDEYIEYALKMGENVITTAPVLTADAADPAPEVAVDITVDIDEATIPSIVAIYTDYLTFTVNPDYVAA